MNNFTQTTHANFIPEIWAKDVRAEVETKLIFKEYMLDFSSLMGPDGNLLHVPNVSNLVANVKVPNVNAQLQSPTEGEFTMGPTQHIECSFGVEDATQLEANQTLKDHYTKKSAYALANKFDEDAAALAASFTHEAGAYNTAITVDAVLDAVEDLDVADVPEEDRHLIVDSPTMRDLRDINEFINSDYVNNRGRQDGKIPELYGAMVHKSNNIVKSGNNTNNMLFHKDAMAYVIQKDITTESDRDVLGIRDVVVTHFKYGMNVFRPEFGVLVKS